MLSDLFSEQNLMLCSDSRTSVLHKRKLQENEQRENFITNSFKLTKTYRIRYNSDNYLPRLCNKVAKYGFAVIEKRRKNIIKRKILEKMLIKAMEIEDIVCNRLDSMNIPCRNISKKIIKQVNDGSKQCNFKFQEV